jgi:hypothetical protein
MANKSGKQSDLYALNTDRSERFGYLLLGGLAVELIFAVFIAKPWLEWASTLISDAMIVIGVWGEIHFGRKARVAGDAAQAEANARAEEAIRATETEKRERIALEVQIAPRRIPLYQRESLTKDFSKLRGHKIRVTSYGLDAEGAILGGQLIACFRAAGVAVDDCLLSHGGLGAVATGILIAKNPDDPEDGTASEILNALWTHSFLVADFGEPPHTGGMHVAHDGGPVAATVFVGVKPIITEDSKHPVAKHKEAPEWWG